MSNKVIFLLISYYDYGCIWINKLNDRLLYFTTGEVMATKPSLQLTCTKYKNLKPKGSIKQNYLK